MNIPCYHLHNYELVTSGDVPITLTLFISAFRNQAGLWAIEQVRPIGNPVLWFCEDQGHEAELIRPDMSHIWPRFFVEHCAKRLIAKDEHWPGVCRLLNEEEEAGRFRFIA